MKTLRNIFALTAVVTLGAGLSFATPAVTGKNNRKPVAYAKEKTGISQHANSVAYYESKVDALEAQLKADKKADRDEAVVSDRQNLRKAKADLKREKEYLRADEKALKSKHCAAVKAQKRELKEDRAELRKTKRQLHRDIRRGNEAAVVAGATALARQSKEVKAEEMALEQKRDAMDADLAWADDVTDNDRTSVKVQQRSQSDIEDHQADMAYEGARWLIITENE